MAQLTQADLIEINRSFEDRSPGELIRWAHSTFGERLASISAMQKSGSMICHMISELGLPIKVLFVDTGVMFSETLATRDRIAKEYGLQIETLTPEKTMEDQTCELGILYLTPDGQKQCCDLRKTQPMRKVMHRFDALIGSLRRSDGGKRAECPVLAIDADMDCLRINPLVNVSDEQLKNYIAENDVILNPLHRQGYTTIGCDRCTTPVLPNEPVRAGRWRHLGPWSVYCGINPTDLDAMSSPSIDFPDLLIDRILGREVDYMI